MGTWGAGNLDSDAALDVVDEDSRVLFDRIAELLASEEATQFDEDDHAELFVRFGALFALDAHRMINWWTCPTPADAEAAKAQFLPRWAAYFDEGSGASEAFTVERRAVIEATFDRFIAGCTKRHTTPDAA